MTARSDVHGSRDGIKGVGAASTLPLMHPVDWYKGMLLVNRCTAY